MPKLVVLCINGYSASSKRETSRTSTLLQSFLDVEGVDYCYEHFRASLLRRRTREATSYLQSLESDQRDLLVVGKSYGAKILVERVLNRLLSLNYRNSFLLTIDPNWSLWYDWTPNLNRRTLKLTRPVSHAINVYVVGEPRQQCGAILATPQGTPTENVPVVDNYDHHSIVWSPEVSSAMKKLIRASKA